MSAVKTVCKCHSLESTISPHLAYQDNNRCSELCVHVKNYAYTLQTMSTFRIMRTCTELCINKNYVCRFRTMRGCSGLCVHTRNYAHIIITMHACLELCTHAQNYECMLRTMHTCSELCAHAQNYAGMLTIIHEVQHLAKKTDMPIVTLR